MLTDKPRVHVRSEQGYAGSASLNAKRAHTQVVTTLVSKVAIISFNVVYDSCQGKQAKLMSLNLPYILTVSDVSNG